MPVYHGLCYEGSPDAPVMVVADVPSHTAYTNGTPIYGAAGDLFFEFANRVGLRREDMLIVSPCPPMNDMQRASQALAGQYLNTYHPVYQKFIERQRPRLVMPMGAYATRQVYGRPKQITRVRGVLDCTTFGFVVLPMLSYNMVLIRPQNRRMWHTDFNTLQNSKRNGYSLDYTGQRLVGDYSWCTDLTPMLENRPRAMAVDTETTGLKWVRDDVFPLTVQITTRPGQGVICPLDRTYYPDITAEQYQALHAQLADLLGDPTIAKAGHNLKFDHHMLRKAGLPVRGWTADGQLLAFFIDENIQQKGLDECTRIFVPEMSGYADGFNSRVDKSNMRAVGHDDMMTYGCQDTDATFRLCSNLTAQLREEPGNHKCYTEIQLPAIVNFADNMEVHGIRMDLDMLRELGETTRASAQEMHDQLVAAIPAPVRRAHADAGKALKLTRDDLVRDALFTDQGMGFVPPVTTATGKPSVGKEALTVLADETSFAGTLLEWRQLSKLASTYVGMERNEKGKPTGMWQHLVPHRDGGHYIHPSFMLHRTNTGRTASADPNGQNFPKRGPHAKAFRRCMIAPPGWVLIEVDLSQIELRLVAWMAQERNMLEVYLSGGDIHLSTAISASGLSESAFMALPDEQRSLFRTRAKAINFGFIYGMWWTKFVGYAKVQYGIDLTDEEAQLYRERFFAQYSGLEGWQERQKKLAHRDGRVTALHGAIRHLPDIYSPDDGIMKEAERQAVNAPIQRFASDLGLIAFNRLCRDMPPGFIKPVAFIHDALVVMAPEDRGEEAAAIVQWYMETPPLEQWFGITAPLPILADASIGRNLGDMDEMEGLQSLRPDWADPNETLISHAMRDAPFPPTPQIGAHAPVLAGAGRRRGLA